jgi:hypothetical protein
VPDPGDESSSDVESFNEDDMYGSDHGMEIVSESPDDEEEGEISPLSENATVSGKACLIMSEDLIMSRMMVLLSCFRRCRQHQQTW